MKGIDLLTGIVVSRQIFKQLILMYQFIKDTEQSSEFNKYLSKLSEEQQLKIIEQELGK